MSSVGPDDRRQAVLAFLHERGAAGVEHLWSDLLSHLLGVEALLRAWGAGEDLALAGLCHAAYGTDGFAPSLLGTDQRDRLAAVAGPAVEAQVYLYASCDRGAVYPRLAGPGPVAFRDRFAGADVAVHEAQVAALVDLTLANEVELAVTSPGGPGSWTWLADFWRSAGHRASPSVRAGAASALGLVDSGSGGAGG